jgi:hypothetical protein
VLGQKEYKLLSCVPAERYPNTHYQKYLAGVPRYVLTKNSEEGLQQRNEALESLSTANCLSLFIGNFHDETRKDSLIHIETDDGYESRKFDFASKSVRKAVERHLLKVGSADVVAFFRQHIDSGIYGNVLGSLYERVAHVILVEGGSFNGKKVFVGGGHEDVEFQFEKFSIQEFEDVKELSGIRAGTYCIPTSSNFQSVDAVVLRDVLLQVFTIKKGKKHGFKVQGLRNLHDVLGQKEYKLLSCVPAERYPHTHYQKYLTKGGVDYTKSDALLDLFVQYVVEVDFRCYCKKG